MTILAILHFTLKGCVTTVALFPLYTRRHLSGKIENKKLSNLKIVKANTFSRRT